MNALDTILSLHTFSTIAMFGLIWFVQLVHYPLFHRVGREDFADYEETHQRRTTWVVAPLMSVELVSSVALVLMAPQGLTRQLALGGLGLLALIWVSTLLLQIPCHRKLAHGYDATTVRRLVASNWVRTIAWTGRAVVVVALLITVNGQL